MYMNREKMRRMEEKYDVVRKKIEENKEEIKKLRQTHALKKKLRGDDYKENKKRLVNIQNHYLEKKLKKLENISLKCQSKKNSTEQFCHSKGKLECEMFRTSEQMLTDFQTVTRKGSNEEQKQQFLNGLKKNLSGDFRTTTISIFDGNK